MAAFGREPRVRVDPSRQAAVALLAVAALSGVRTLPAQSSDELDSGTFELLQDGDVVGIERFVIRHDGTAVRAAARVTSNRGSARVQEGEVRLLLDGSFHPERYELKPEEGPLESVVGLRRGNRLRVQSDSDEGERVKEFVAPAGLSVLERGYAHHYFLLLQLLSKAPRGTALSLVVPSEGKQFRATIRDEGEDLIPIGGATISAHHYVIEGGGVAHAVWADSDGRVLRVEIPQLGWAAQRRP